MDALRAREKAHTREGDAIAAARRRLPMVEVDGSTPLVSEHGPVTLSDAFEGRRMLVAYYFMWHAGRPAPEQCEGCTFYTSQVRELSFLHSRDVTYATFCQGPYEESARYRKFMGWEMPWYCAQGNALDTLLVGRRVGMMHIVCYLRQGSNRAEAFAERGHFPRQELERQRLAAGDADGTASQPLQVLDLRLHAFHVAVVLAQEIDEHLAGGG
jgi:hypothetical protein